MKIGPQDSKPLITEGGGATAKAEGALSPQARASLARAGGVAGALANATSVSLSAAASAASAALSASSAADVDMDKVRQVQTALAQGQYKVNPEAIADELIASAESFMPKRAGR